MNQTNDPLTDGIEVPGDIVFICRVPTILPVCILSVGVVLKSNHSENIETILNHSSSGGRRYIALVCLTLNTEPFVLSAPLTQYCAGDEIEKNETVGARRAFGGEEWRVQGFGGET